MNVKELEALRNTLKSCRPPMDLALLETFINLDWLADAEHECGVLCDIIIRIGVDVIMCASDLHGPRKELYRLAFQRLSDKIETSNLLSRSTEFQSYFASYKDYLADFQD